MPAGTHGRAAAVSPALKRARHLIAASLVQAMRAIGASQNVVARWTNKSARTVRNWVHEQNPINVEAVLASPKLGELFRRALCTHEHAPVGYVARRRARVTDKRSAKARRGRP